MIICEVAMAVQFVDSFDHYQTADITKKYNSVQNAEISATAARYRTGCQSLKLQSGFGQAHKVFPTPINEIVVGFWWYPDFSVRDNDVIEWWSVTKASFLQANANGTWSFYRSDPYGHVLLGSGGNFTFQEGQYIEAKFKYDDATGYVIVRRNGTEVLNISNVNTKGYGQVGVSPTPTMLSVGLCNIGTVLSSYSYFDDFYIADLTGGVNDDFLGDVNIACLKPTGNGAKSEWTGSDGNQVDNYALVDEQLLDTADYVRNTVLGNTDLYPFEHLLSGTPLAVQMSVACDKDDVADRYIQGVAQVGGVEYPTTDIDVSTTTYIKTKVMNQNPAGGPWSRAIINASEFGVHDES